jgi:hypothetical protein
MFVDYTVDAAYYPPRRVGSSSNSPNILNSSSTSSKNVKSNPGRASIPARSSGPDPDPSSPHSPVKAKMASKAFSPGSSEPPPHRSVPQLHTPSPSRAPARAPPLYGGCTSHLITLYERSSQNNPNFHHKSVKITFPDASAAA